MGVGVGVGGEWWGECARAGPGAPNKGLARRPQRFLEGLYVAIPAFGGEWEWGWRRRVSTNKGFARRPQRLLEGLYVAIPAFGRGMGVGVRLHLEGSARGARSE